MKVITEKITIEELRKYGEDFFDNMIKAVVDVEQRIMAVGVGMHADAEYILLDQGSIQENLWGINLLYDVPREEMIEFDSYINIRPRQNRSRIIQDPEICRVITNIVNELVE